MTMRSILVLLSAFVLLTGAALGQSSKPRVIVLTDITNEPDDQESLVRFLVYANEYDVEGLIATTSTWLRDRTSVPNIKACVEAYGQVRDNLAKHADGFPTQEKLESVIFEGLPEFGMSGVGQGKDSPGSEHVIKVIDAADERPVWVTAWGGANCLAQALWKVRSTRSPSQLADFISKIRVYTISDQDNSGPWMRNEFPELFYVVSPGGEKSLEYHQATWTGISGDEYYLNGPGYAINLVSNDWLDRNIRIGHGPLGAMYPEWEYIMEGDTPSFMNLINNGLASHLNPSFGGWGGRYYFKQTYADAGPFWQNTRDFVLTSDGRVHVSNTATIWRWRQDFQLDFAARMDWCVKDRDEANHNPIASVNGDDSKEPLRIKVKPGQVLRLSAEDSLDPDGDEIGIRWFHYGEAERDLPNIRSLFSVPIEDANTEICTVRVPEKLPRDTTSIHIILDVVDSGEPSLHAYRRIILEVE